MEQRTEGWLVGLKLTGLSLRNHADPAHFLSSFQGDNRYILDYLMDDVYDRLGRSTRKERALDATFQVLAHFVP